MFQAQDDTDFLYTSSARAIDWCRLVTSVHGVRDVRGSSALGG